MPRKLYSERRRADLNLPPRPLVYDTFTHPLRVQVIYNIMSYIEGSTGPIEPPTTGRNFDMISGRQGSATLSGHIVRSLVNTFRQRLGVFELPGRPRLNYNKLTPWEETQYFIQAEQDVEIVLDFIELIYGGEGDEEAARMHKSVCEEELNASFLQHSVGYYIREGTIHRVDSDAIHSEVTTPALSLLRAAEFAGAESEFHAALAAHRSGDHKQVLVECGKMLESTLKSICVGKGWAYDPKATLDALKKVCVDNGLIPAFLDEHFNNLKALIGSGVAQLRNKMGAHGQGNGIIDVPEHLSAYAIHLAASNVLLLVRAYEALA